MSTRNRILAALSNESLQEDPNAAAAAAGGETTAVEAPIEAPAEVEQPLMEVAEAEGEADQALAAADEATEVVEALESLQDLLEGHQEDGLNPQAAEIAQFAVEQLYKRVGLSNGHGLPSLESFSGHSNRVRATQLSQEAIGQKIKEFWAAIVQMLIKAKEAVFNFIKKIFDAHYRVSERAKSLAGKVDGLTGTPKDGEIDLGSLAQKVAIGDKVATPLHSAITAVQDVLKDVLSFGEAETKSLTESYEAVKAAVEGGSAGDSKVYGGFELAASKAFKNAVNGREGVKATDVLPGNVKFFLGTEKSKLGNLLVNYAVSGKIKDSAKAGNTKIKVLSKEEIKQAISAIELLLQQAKAVSDAASKEVERSKKTFASIKVGDEAKIKDQVVLRSLMRAFQKQEAEQGKAAGRVASYAVELSNDVLNVLQKCMVAYDRGNADAGAKQIGQDKKEDKK